MTTRVLIVLTSTQRRGAEIEGSQLAVELDMLALPASVVALSPGPGAGAGAGRLDLSVLGERPLSVGGLRELRRIARTVDVVLAFGSSALPACALALLGTRTPFVYRSIGDPARWVRGRWHRRRTGLLFRRAAHVVALWPAAADTIGRLYGVRPDSISCIPNARPSVVDGTITAAAARGALELPAHETVVAWVGAYSAEKRPTAAIEAVADVPGAWLLMAGAGPLADEVAAAAARLQPGRHRLSGPVDDLSSVWAAADVVLLTSATEGMPGVLLEASLHGVPAVATDVGAVGEVVVDGQTGRLVGAAATPAVVAAALTEAVAHSSEWGSAARAHAVALFTWPTVAPAWAALLTEVGSRVR